MSFGWDTNSCWSLLSGVYASGSKRSHQSALECVTVVDSTTHSKLPDLQSAIMRRKTLPCTCIGRRRRRRRRRRIGLQTATWSPVAWPCLVNRLKVCWAAVERRHWTTRQLWWRQRRGDRATKWCEQRFYFTLSPHFIRIRTINTVTVLLPNTPSDGLWTAGCGEGRAR